MDHLAACPQCGHGLALHEDPGCTERCGCNLSRRRAVDMELDTLQSQSLSRWQPERVPRRRR